jgi:preprotein translocase subunit SecA
MLNGVNKEVTVLIQRRFRQSAPDIEEAVEVREDYKLSKDEVPNSESANRELVKHNNDKLLKLLKEIC